MVNHLRQSLWKHHQTLVNGVASEFDTFSDTGKKEETGCQRNKTSLIQEAEAGGIRVQGQFRVCDEMLPSPKVNLKIKNKFKMKARRVGKHTPQSIHKAYLLGNETSECKNR